MEIIWDDMIEFAIITLLYWHLFSHHIRNEKCVVCLLGMSSHGWGYGIKLKYVFYCVWHDISVHRMIRLLFIVYLMALHLIEHAFGYWYRFPLSHANRILSPLAKVVSGYVIADNEFIFGRIFWLFWLVVGTLIIIIIIIHIHYHFQLDRNV